MQAIEFGSHLSTLLSEWPEAPSLKRVELGIVTYAEGRLLDTPSVVQPSNKKVAKAFIDTHFMVRVGDRMQQCIYVELFLHGGCVYERLLDIDHWAAAKAIGAKVNELGSNEALDVAREAFEFIAEYGEPQA